MKKQIHKSILIAIMLSILMLPFININAQTITGSQLSFGKDESIKYHNGSAWVTMPSGLPGQDLTIVNGIPAWVNNPNGILTKTVTNIGGTTAMCGGIIASSSGSAITARGICWSTNHNPTITDYISVDDSTGKGDFYCNLEGLSNITTYYVRAFATNSAGTSYGNEVSLITIISPVSDIDGNGYDTVRIGDQTWLKQNLKTTKYRNGDAIPNVTDNTAWAVLSTGAYGNYNNDTNKAVTYGRLYNFYTVVDSRNLCPTGWHVPSDAEMSTLLNYLGGSGAGGRLKEEGLSHWNSPNIGASNETGFTALPAGIRLNDGTYANIGNYGYWWSTTESNINNAWYWFIPYDGHSFSNFSFYKQIGFSVRCLKDSVNSVALKPVYDIDGNGYDTVHIGTQVWMKQNLKTTKYRNGDAIPNVTDNTAWAGLTTGAYSNYNNDTNMGNIYGRFYNFYTVADSRNLCPIGWHVPSDGEWTTLTSYLGGESIAGGKIKEAGTLHWSSPNTGATNEVGFTAIPAGYSGYDGVYRSFGDKAYWWSSTEANTWNAFYFYVWSSYSSVFRTNYFKQNGFSVRCLKDSINSVALKPVYDIDGNGYDTVHIGTQVWMKQNLKTAHFNNGDSIPNIIDGGVWAATTSSACCYYNNNATYDAVYGKLYNCWAVQDSRALCPVGWRTPSATDFSILETYLGGESIAGGKLKEVGLDHWLSQTGSTNETGFTALAGGCRYTTGSYGSMGTYAYFWSLTQSDAFYAWFRRIQGFNTIFTNLNANKANALSVRCIKN